MKRLVPLECEAEKVADANSICPLIFQVPPCEGRKRLDQAQDTPINTYPVSTEVIMVNTGTWGKVKLYCVTPCCYTQAHHVIYYIHGAGWVFGNFHTHYKLVCEIANRTNSIVLFPEYSLSPEAKYPTAIEQCYSILNNLPNLVCQMGLEVSLETLTVAGDSVGGNMATVMTILSKYRKGPCIHKQLLFYPVTNACFNTNSYHEFATDYYLYRAGMIWFWNQYTHCLKDRYEITASPLRATLDQLHGLPSAMIINGEADVLCDEGQAYARKLRMAGVDVTAIRIQGIIHDFVMLNALDQTNACRAAMDSAVEWVNRNNCW
ncbi:alpha/beta hydrolase [Anaerosporobacter faecicola]|uniref:alpha/beta hydrolase n=1 Tax=Anaerosporobacter faecicola TaxID=2718714 RepID=UPI00143C4D47|nr:alpha/beta hydrolase [Anaerosporobacter faecicola]